MVIRLHLNESPYGVPDDILRKALDPAGLDVNRYPQRERTALLRELYAAYASRGAGEIALSADQVVATNGADEAIDITVLALRPRIEQVVILPPTFSEYPRAARLAGVKVTGVPLVESSPAAGQAARETAGRREPGRGEVGRGAAAGRGGPGCAIDLDRLTEACRRTPSLVFICSPNNPTGGLLAAREALQALTSLPTPAWVAVDEAYWEFAGTTLLPELGRHPNLIILRTMSKAFCLAGIRLGYALASPELARALNRTRMVFNIDSMTAAVAVAALREPGYVREVVTRVVEGRRHLIERLSALPGVTPYPSRANFVFCRVPRPATEVVRAMEERGVLVRHYPKEPTLSHHIRISVGTPEETGRCLEALQESIRSEQPAAQLPSHHLPGGRRGWSRRTS